MWTNVITKARMILGAHLTCTRVKKGVFYTVIENLSLSLVVGDLNVCV